MEEIRSKQYIIFMMKIVLKDAFYIKLTSGFVIRDGSVLQKK